VCVQQLDQRVVPWARCVPPVGTVFQDAGAVHPSMQQVLSTIAKITMKPASDEFVRLGSGLMCCCVVDVLLFGRAGRAGRVLLVKQSGDTVRWFPSYVCQTENCANPGPDERRLDCGRRV